MIILTYHLSPVCVFVVSRCMHMCKAMIIFSRGGTWYRHIYSPSTSCKISLLYSLGGWAAQQHEDCHIERTGQEQQLEHLVSNVHHIQWSHVSLALKDLSQWVLPFQLMKSHSSSKWSGCFLVGCSLPVEAQPASLPKHQICSISWNGCH